MKKLRRSVQAGQQAGQALVEFALVLMFIILPFTFVLIDGAVMLYVQAAIANTVREAARAGSIYQSSGLPGGLSFNEQVTSIDTDRLAYIQLETTHQLGPLLSLPPCSVNVTYSPNPPTLGNPYRQLDSMSVTLACPHRLLFGLVNIPEIKLQSESTMRIEPGGVAPSP